MRGHEMRSLMGSENLSENFQKEFEKRVWRILEMNFQKEFEKRVWRILEMNFQKEFEELHESIGSLRSSHGPECLGYGLVLFL